MNMQNDFVLKDKPLFFLFTCVKNGRSYINKLFISLLGQSKINFIHYIYDDGSEDPIDDLVHKYKEEANKLQTPFTIIYEKASKNIGLNLATQHCINKCNCKYFIWIDCDNWVDSDFFNQLEKTVKKNPKAIMIKSYLFSVNESTSEVKPLSKLQIKRQNSNHQDKLFFYQQYVYSFFAINNKYYRLINPNNFFLKKRSFFNDGQVICHCIFSKKKIIFSKKAIGYFLERPSSESRNYDDDDTVSYFKDIKLLAVNDNSTYSDFVEHIPLNSYLFRKMYNAYYICKSIKKSREHYSAILKNSREKGIPKYLSFKNGNALIWWLKLYVPITLYLRKIFKKSNKSD